MYKTVYYRNFTVYFRDEPCLELVVILLQLELQLMPVFSVEASSRVSCEVDTPVDHYLADLFLIPVSPILLTIYLHC